MPREDDILATDRIPDDIRDQAKEMGLFGYAIPEEWAASVSTSPRTSSWPWNSGTTLSLRSMFGTNNGIAGQVLVNFGTDEAEVAVAGEDRLR